MAKRSRIAAGVGARTDSRHAKRRAERKPGSSAATRPQWMDALPEELLISILRRLGRTVRQVCRRWRIAYGPPAGLYLDPLPMRRDLLNLIPHPAASPLAAVPALYLAPPPTPRYTHARPFNGAILAALPATFPTLRALHLATNVPLTANQVPLLAPLAPHLTALTLCLSTAPAAAALPTALPTLRSLTLHSRTLAPLLPSLTPLAPTLQRLSFLNRPGFDALLPAPATLPHLAPLSRLTSLHLLALLSAWDAPSLALLSTAWPRLASLHLRPDFTPPLHPPPGAPPPPQPPIIISALARRTALTSLVLEGPPANTHPLTALQNLAALELLTPRSHATHPIVHTLFLAPLAPMATLTRLTLGSNDTPLSHDLLEALAPLGPTLRHFAFIGRVAPFSTLVPLSRLTALRTLSLDDIMWHLEPPPAPAPTLVAARAIGTALPHLTSLRVYDHLCRWPVDALLASTAAHGRLRHFRTNRYLPRLAACLAPASASLTRASITVPRDGVRPALQSLAAATALRALILNILPRDSVAGLPCDTLRLADAAPAAAPGASPSSSRSGGAAGTAPGAAAPSGGPVPGSGSGGAGVAPPEAGGAAGGSASTASRSSRAARRRAEVPAAAAPGAEQAAPRLLPAGLRLLCVDEERVDAGVWEALVGAAAGQGCEVWSGGPRVAEYDDCNGWLEGAAPECLARMEGARGVALAG